MVPRRKVPWVLEFLRSMVRATLPLTASVLMSMVPVVASVTLPLVVSFTT